jgi:AraC-like DNA-binding protein
MRARFPMLNRRCIVGLVWHHLDAHPGHRPAVRDLARAFGRSTRWLRRAWCRLIGGDPIRKVAAYGSMTYGLRLIAGGVKPEAAARIAGFRSYWHFNRLCKRYTGHTASHWRSGAPLQISEAEVADAVKTLGTAPAAPSRPLPRAARFVEARVAPGEMSGRLASQRLAS